VAAFLAALCLGSLSAIWATPSFAIVNGQPVSGTSYAYVGYLVGSDQCTATLIAPDWALTAGHCVNTSASQVHITFNFNRLAKPLQPLGGEPRTAAQVFIANSGLALVRLDVPVTDVQPVQLATPANQSYLVKTGYNLTAVGWGTINAKGTISSLELRSGLTHVADSSTIDPFESGQIKTNMSKAAPAESNKGDSGGPLLSYLNGDVEVGIANQGYYIPHVGLYASYYVPVGNTGVYNWISGACACL
jgi:Trypsin